MDALEWETCNKPRRMLRAVLISQRLRRRGKRPALVNSSRKLHLLGIAVARLSLAQLNVDWTDELLAEQDGVADGARYLANYIERRAALLSQAAVAISQQSPLSAQFNTLCGLLKRDSRDIAEATIESLRGRDAEPVPAIIRDMLGNPYLLDVLWHPAFDDTNVKALAGRAYAERIPYKAPADTYAPTLPWPEPLTVANCHLDPRFLAILADALQDAGFDNARLLQHLRSPGPHHRGCWALDCVLGKACR